MIRDVLRSRCGVATVAALFPHGAQRSDIPHRIPFFSNRRPTLLAPSLLSEKFPKADTEFSNLYNSDLYFSDPHFSVLRRRRAERDGFAYGTEIVKC